MTFWRSLEGIEISKLIKYILIYTPEHQSLMPEKYLDFVNSYFQSFFIGESVKEIKRKLIYSEGQKTSTTTEMLSCTNLPVLGGTRPLRLAATDTRPYLSMLACKTKNFV